MRNRICSCIARFLGNSCLGKTLKGSVEMQETQTPAIQGVGDNLPSAGFSGSGLVSVMKKVFWVEKKSLDLKDGVLCPAGEGGQRLVPRPV